MPSDQSTVDYLQEQMSRGNDIRTRKMFGEYGVYCGEVFVGVVCDDQLYLKITDAGRRCCRMRRRERPIGVRNRT